ncbi:unnamed protein product [Somion occarium]|uniref:Uncharacterized protein n=1 Tax=Somion occarium TaxID=3059160 RepID=A0ABP1DXK6_9APHY
MVNQCMNTYCRVFGNPFWSDMHIRSLLRRSHRMKVSALVPTTQRADIGVDWSVPDWPTKRLEQRSDANSESVAYTGRPIRIPNSGPSGWTLETRFMSIHVPPSGSIFRYLREEP